MADIPHNVDLSFQQDLLLLVHLLSASNIVLLLYDLYRHHFACLFLPAADHLRVASSTSPTRVLSDGLALVKLVGVSNITIHL